MAKDEVESRGAAELRRLAEERMAREAADFPDLPPEEARKLLQELRTHQIELEMQNEELRAAQDELVASRNRYADLYDFAPVGYVTVSAKGLVVEANLRFAEMLGVERRTVMTKRLSAFILPADQDVFYRHLREGGASNRRATCQLRLRRGDAEPLWVEMDTIPRPADEGRDAALRVAVSDIAARKELEQRVIHLERMGVAGELAAGVSHNLNNMLTAVLGPTQILLLKSDDPRVRLEAQTILTAGQRAQDLVARLSQAVGLTRQAMVGPVSLNEEVRKAIELSRPRWKDEPESRGVRIEVVADFGEVPDISGNSTELGDALLNLVLNAVQAMPEGGTLTFATREMGAGVQLAVRDTGIGMDEETRRRVFEPFFTTKRDVGSGLGLATVHGMVTRWGGRIAVDSTPGEGSTFTLWLPVWGHATVAAGKPVTGATPVRPGRLLIVEDDESVRSVLERLLSETHTVTVAGDGREALEQFVADEYDVALIDLGMPGLAGDQVAAQMRQLDPALATVLVTGWVLEPEDARLRWFDLQIPKPFTDLNEVESVVAQAIVLHDARG